MSSGAQLGGAPLQNFILCLWTCERAHILGPSHYACIIISISPEFFCIGMLLVFLYVYMNYACMFWTPYHDLLILLKDRILRPHSSEFSGGRLNGALREVWRRGGGVYPQPLEALLLCHFPRRQVRVSVCVCVV